MFLKSAAAIISAFIAAAIGAYFSLTPPDQYAESSYSTFSALYRQGLGVTLPLYLLIGTPMALMYEHMLRLTHTNRRPASDLLRYFGTGLFLGCLAYIILHNNLIPSTYFHFFLTLSLFGAAAVLLCVIEYGLAFLFQKKKRGVTLN